MSKKTEIIIGKILNCRFGYTIFGIFLILTFFILYYIFKYIFLFIAETWHIHFIYRNAEILSCDLIYLLICAAAFYPTWKNNKQVKNNDPKERELLTKDEEKIRIFKTNVKNARLIDEVEGILPIEGSHVGQILINETDRTVLIEIKQCTKPQIIEYFEGHLLCRDAEFEVIETNINGGVFILNKDKDNPSRYELQLNNNRQGVIIKCSEIELIDYQNIHKPIEEYKDIFIGSQFGKFFSIKYDKR